MMNINIIRSEFCGCAAAYIGGTAVVINGDAHTALRIAQRFGYGNVRMLGNAFIEMLTAAPSILTFKKGLVINDDRGIGFWFRTRHFNYEGEDVIFIDLNSTLNVGAIFSRGDNVYTDADDAVFSISLSNRKVDRHPLGVYRKV